MAKSDKARMRVFFAEVEGDNETLRDGLQSIAAAVNKTFQPNTRILQIKQIESGEDLDGEELIDELEDELQTEDDQPVVTKKKISKAKTKRTPPSYKIVDDLDLRPSELQSLKEFYAEKSPKDDQQRIAIFVYYLDKTLSVENIGLDHIYTCYQEVDERSPTNIGQIVTNTINRKGWVKGNKSDLKSTTAGINFVKYDLPSGDDNE